MRVRPDIHPLPGDELHRSHLVEEDERPDHLPLELRQRPAHREAAQVAHPRHHDQFQRVAGPRIAQDRIV